MLLSIIVKFVLYLSYEKNKNKQKEAGFGPFFDKKSMLETCMLLIKVHLGLVTPQKSLVNGGYNEAGVIILSGIDLQK